MVVRGGGSGWNGKRGGEEVKMYLSELQDKEVHVTFKGGKKMDIRC